MHAHTPQGGDGPRSAGPEPAAGCDAVLQPPKRWGTRGVRAAGVIPGVARRGARPKGVRTVTNGSPCGAHPRARCAAGRPAAAQPTNDFALSMRGPAKGGAAAPAIHSQHQRFKKGRALAGKRLPAGPAARRGAPGLSTRAGSSLRDGGAWGGGAPRGAGRFGPRRWVKNAPPTPLDVLYNQKSYALVSVAVTRSTVKSIA
ncbi:MAG: hypothetical protein J3K34DRAFT_516720, partial [Monoraphidium minutum]